MVNFMASNSKTLDDKWWEFTARAIVRAIQVAIETHEKHGEEYIHVDWLRDYADDIAVQFPKTAPEQL